WLAVADCSVIEDAAGASSQREEPSKQQPLDKMTCRCRRWARLLSGVSGDRSDLSNSWRTLAWFSRDVASTSPKHCHPVIVALLLYLIAALFPFSCHLRRTIVSDVISAVCAVCSVN